MQLTTLILLSLGWLDDTYSSLSGSLFLSRCFPLFQRSIVRLGLSPNQARLLRSVLFAYFIFDISSNFCSVDNSVRTPFPLFSPFPPPPHRHTYLPQESCAALSIMQLVIHSLILLGIIISMNFTVTQLKAMLIHTPWVPSTPMQVQ